jgi:hypothetical protein
MDEASDDDAVYEDGRGTTTWPCGFEDASTSHTRENPMLDAESNALRRVHETAGMREGYEAGKEETVQAGFDHGFRLASTAGFAWGRALGMAAMLDVACGMSRDEIKEGVCDALWEEHGEMKERFPEKRGERKERGGGRELAGLLRALEMDVRERRVTARGEDDEPDRHQPSRHRGEHG